MPGGSEASAGAREPWCDKYRARRDSAAATPSSNLAVFDFGSVKSVPPGDWAAAQAAEARHHAELPGALRRAQHAKYRRVDAMPCFALRGGGRLPAVGLGTWKAERGQVRSAVHVALQAGYRHIDCASVYQNEEEVGEALEAALSSGAVPRAELFVCSKVWNNDHSAGRVRAACLRSLKALRLSYLDLYMIHWPVAGNVGDDVRPPIRETWRAMEALVREGLVRSLGVSNFSAVKLAAIEAYAEVPPAVCQVEVHPYHRNDALLAWCTARGIHVTAFSPLGSPDSESIFPRKVPAVLMDDPVVRAVAARTGRNVGQVLIRWALQHGTSVIPKSTNAARIRGNLDVLGWELAADDYAALSTLAFQQRMVNGALWLNPRGPYRTMEELWDEPEAADPGEPLPREPGAGVREGGGRQEGSQSGADVAGESGQWVRPSEGGGGGARTQQAGGGAEPVKRRGSGSHPVDVAASTGDSDSGSASGSASERSERPAGPAGAAGGGSAEVGKGQAKGWGSKLSSWLSSKKSGA